MKPYDIKGLGRHYPHPVHGEKKPLTSVTNILNEVAKQMVLSPWAAKLQKEMDVELSKEMFNTCGPFTSGDHFARALSAFIGKERKYKEEFTRAGEIGTLVHDSIEFFIKGLLGLEGPEPPTLEGEAMVSYLTFEQFWLDVDIRPLFSELFVWNDIDNHAGTADLVSEIVISDVLLKHASKAMREIARPFLGKNVLTGIDFKTSNGIYDDYFLQLAAYIDSLERMGKASEDTWGMIVRLPKDGTPWEVAFLPPSDREEAYDTFLAYQKAWRFSHRKALAKLAIG